MIVNNKTNSFGLKTTCSLCAELSVYKKETFLYTSIHPHKHTYIRVRSIHTDMQNSQLEERKLNYTSFLIFRKLVNRYKGKKEKRSPIRHNSKLYMLKYESSSKKVVMVIKQEQGINK